MNLYSDIQAYYTDGNSLVTPSRYTATGNGQGSDNGPMYTAEFYVMLIKNYKWPWLPVAKMEFTRKISRCIDARGNLRRVPDPTPVGQSNRQVGPDDYIGVLNASKQLGDTKIPRTFLKAIILGKGTLNNESPGKWSWRSFLARQPQLLAAMISASFPEPVNPLHMLIRAAALPLYIYTAAAITISCWRTPIGNTDARRLSWHLVQVTQHSSLLCWLASKIWYARLCRDYGSDGMKAVAAVYYEKNHPFANYWVTK